MATVELSRQLKRALRRVSPQLADRLRDVVAARTREPEVDWAPLGQRLAAYQHAFDAHYGIDDADVADVARQSSLVFVALAPFENVALAIDELERDGLVFGEIVIVDATAEEPRRVAIRDHLMSWRNRLPLTHFNVITHEAQELRYAAAVEAGWQAAAQPHRWVVGRHHVALPGSFRYLVKSLIAQSAQAVVVSSSAGPGGTLRGGAINPSALQPAVRERLLGASAFDVSIGLAPYPGAAAAAAEFAPLIEPLDSFHEGVFGGPASLLADAAGRLLDPLFITDAAVADLGLRLNARGVPLVETRAALARSLRGASTDAAAAWEAIHDWRWLLDKRDARPVDAERIELVCPCHRGDTVLAAQVAAYLMSRGQRVRLHVAKSLVDWVRDFAPDLPVEALPVSVPSAEDTYPTLLASYRHVATREDASPRLARCHPSRHLSGTGMNLIGFMLEEVGLAVDTRVPNLRPVASAEQRAIAEQRMAALGANVIFVHPRGGWGLKSIPDAVMAELAEAVHRAGFKLVQMGGKGDAPVAHCDDALLENYQPSQWREILMRARALIGVDSWTAHFGSILDIPQVCLYGSTNPRHVNTKHQFAEQHNACLIMGPVVNCSPCNSLTCTAFPERRDCTGYALDHAQLQDFLAHLPGHAAAA